MSVTPARARAPSGAGSDPRRNSDATATSSPASSQVAWGASRADQIIYRFYLKTVAVLVDGRVTHVSAQRGERKKDRWFNITVPDTEVHKTDLRIYRAVSSYTPLPDPPAGASCSTIPPLLIAFILDTNDIPVSQTLLWNRDGARFALDPSLVKQSGGSGTRRPGIVLERWTLRVTDQEAANLAQSEMAPPTAYRLGIIHFRALYAFIRLLPAYRLFRRLRRLNTGLRLGIKLWGPEGYPNSQEGLDDAWNVMERDLVGIDVPLEYMIPGREPDATTSSTCERYDFPPLQLFGGMYELGVEYRPNMDFDVEDMESVLSERFVDMDEDWFTPTVARHRLEAEARAAGTPPYSSSPSRPSPVQASPSPARYPIPGSSLRYEAGSYRPSSGTTPREPSSLGAAKWGALGENLPFASGTQSDTPPSPSAVTGGAPTIPGPIPYRRPSAHSFQPFHSYSASPSASVLRNLTGVSAGTGGTPAASGTPGTPTTSGSGRAIPGLPSSTGRQSSFLSQSGRSYSHAQMAHLQGGASASPPIGHFGGSPPPFAPSSLSFAKQALPRQSSYGIHSTSSPFVPSSVERDSPLTASGLPKRYSSSLPHHRRSIGSSPQETHGLPSSVSLNRRPSTRESGLRHSLDEAPRDSDDVHAFLRALDSWTPPPSLAPRSSSASLPQSQPGNPAVTTTAPTPGSGGRSPALGSGSGSGVSGTRVPLTRTHVDDMLKRMAGSFGPTMTATGSAEPSRPPSALPTPSSRRDSNGSTEDQLYDAAGVRPLPIGGGALSAQRPATGSPRVASLRNEVTGSPGQVPRGSVPRASGSLPRAPALASTPEEPPCFGAARSLPAGPAKTPGFPQIGGTTPGSPFPSRHGAINGAGLVSPQTTGGTRRGPVLVRGGFGAPSASSKASTSSSSPSHSPVREYRYRSGLTAERERSQRERDGFFAGIGLPSGYAIGGLSGLPPGPFNSFSNAGSRGASSTRRTAPSSLGADHDVPRMRGRVASEGGGSPICERSMSGVRSTSPRSPVVDGLMARLALAHGYDDRAQGRELSSSPAEE
ncbi:uncharacterized protein CcaverHIS019_0101480 [Cutaneotrichosporon cavernicola]|uniref:Autophagy-related protein 13 n=1 Tax=Cutaneotrichosporon cavernicola TaxID=279322 RepID=A0AA48I3Z2_9TREE|nr:uncharacterized protein CcaverHIS019_0101480 [Cutaneotrichosporon cavernicola]BEI87430.1 hypothetical protein CcaverHIS019_0101480 [Cutaneotrichosporon cavernicola]BEI95198.1 hypothetical protein CcaverHIS631_0101470 [Cutaneotrichosporon cavernicola]BEJ02972.1 hypothetical protein CcaverHIS641_0101470 [Cutaneotrichosporon cavernicola]